MTTIDAKGDRSATLQAALHSPDAAVRFNAGLDLVTLDANANAFSIAVLERTFRYPEEKIHARLPEMMLRAFSDRNFMLLYPAVGAGVQIKKPRNAWRKFKRFLGFA